MKVIVPVFMALWCFLSSIVHINADILEGVHVPKGYSNLWKRQDYFGYLKQCSILQFWDKQIGQVNVLAFFDSSRQFSHGQASMLKTLRERFKKTGLDNIQFFAINAIQQEATQIIDGADIELEEEAWKQILPSESDGLPPPITLSPEALIDQLGPDVYFIQDTDELQIWSKLKAYRDQILVIDRCGKLTYEVIVPWSILHFPYVKAAILSTYNDEPCGHCQFQTPILDTTHTNNEESSMSDKSLMNNANTESFDTQVMLEKSLTLNIENKNMPSTSQETSTSIIQDEDSSTPSISEKSATITIPQEHDTTFPLLDKSTSFFQSENNDSLLNVKESSLGAGQTEDISAHETSTHNYNLGASNSNDDLLNLMSNEYIDEYTNFITSTINFESTTENLNTVTLKESENPTAIQVEQKNLKNVAENENQSINYIVQARSSNARSVLSNGLKNHLETVENNSELSDEEDLPAAELMPIRIIMRAPHVDELNDQTLKSHEYLVLKTGLSDYHGHLEPRDDSESNLADDKSEANILAHEKSEIVKRTFGKDESPGLYGEVADYWQNFSNEQIHDSLQFAMANDNQSVENQETSFVEYDTLTPTELSINNERIESVENLYKSSIVTPLQEELIDEKIDDHTPNFNKEVDIVDEEAKSKLIAHYSKLLPWLYYNLAK